MLTAAERGMLAKILRRTGERIDLGWTRFGHAPTVVGDSSSAGCLIEQLTSAYRDVTGSPPALHYTDLVLALAAEIGGRGRTWTDAPAALSRLVLWNDRAERRQAEVSAICYRSADAIEAGG
jgi:hypothetical protein